MAKRQQHKVEPIERFPTKPRKDGRFQKRINGILHYFGSDGDRQQALREYDRVKHALYAGRQPRPAPEAADSLTVFLMSNRFLADKAGHIDDKTWRRYRRALRRFVKWTGRARIWSDLLPDDFTEYGRHLRRKSKLGAYAYNHERAAIVAMFNHADEQDWIDRAPKYGKLFRRIPKRELRSGKANRLLGYGDIAAMLGHAPTLDLFAMILLSLNSGMGAADLCELPRSAMNPETGLVQFPRTKNNIPRTIPLWPETIDAIRRLHEKRPHDRLIFRTRKGNAWSETAIAHEIRKTMTRAELPMPSGVGLGACRHTFATYANEVRDTDARRHIMGRLLPHLDDIYVETVFPERLKKVTDHVRDRLQIAEMVGDRHLLL